MLNIYGVLYFNVKNFFLIFSLLRFLYFHKKKYSLIVSKYIRNRILKAFVKRKKAYTILMIINSMHSSIFHSRKEKEIFMREVIQKLHISIPEKEMYSLCIEVLEDDNFEIFFLKIVEQFEWLWQILYKEKNFNLIS